MWWDKSRTGTKHGRRVVAEAERLLAGGVLNSYLRGGGPAPAWTRVGGLGHGTRAELERIAGFPASPDPDGWLAATARLAGQMLSRSAGDSDLLDLQRRSLVPLELDLLGGNVPEPRTPGELYTLVSGALDRPMYPDC